MVIVDVLVLAALIGANWTLLPIFDLMLVGLVGLAWIINNVIKPFRAKYKNDDLLSTDDIVDVPLFGRSILYGAAVAVIPALSAKYDPASDIGIIPVWIAAGIGVLLGGISLLVIPRRKIQPRRLILRLGILSACMLIILFAISSRWLFTEYWLVDRPILSTRAQVAASVLQPPLIVLFYIGLILLIVSQIVRSHNIHYFFDRLPERSLLLSSIVAAFMIMAYVPWLQVFSNNSYLRQSFQPQNLEVVGEGFYLNDTYPSIIQWGQDLGTRERCEGWYSLIALKNGKQTVGVCYNVTPFSQIMLIDRENQTERSLTTDITNSFQSPIVVTPDEQWIIYVEGVYGWNGLNAVRISDGAKVNVTPAYLHDPHWLPDGRLAATYTVDYDPERRGFITYDFAVPLPSELVSTTP